MLFTLCLILLTRSPPDATRVADGNHLPGKSGAERGQDSPTSAEMTCFTTGLDSHLRAGLPPGYLEDGTLRMGR